MRIRRRPWLRMQREALRGDLGENPSVLERDLVPALVSAADTAVAGRHLRFQQDLLFVVVGGDAAESGDPLRGLYIENTGVVQTGGREDRGIAHGREVLVRCVGLDVAVHLGIVQWIAPFVPLGHREWQRGVEDRGQRVDERDRRMDGPETVWSEIGDRTNQQATSAAAARSKALRRGVAALNQIVRTGHEVSERVLLRQKLSLVVPTAPQFAAAADMGNGIDYAPIQQRPP